MIVSAIIGFFALIAVAYWATHQPVETCFDQIKNQNEQDVDCGGICSLQCLGTRVTPKVSWSKLFMVRSGVYDVAALVEYPSGDTAIPELNYTANIYGDDGKLLASRSSKTFVNSGDHFLLTALGVETNATATRAEVIIDPSYKAFRSTSTPVALSVIARDLSSPDERPRLSANVRNDTTTALANIPVQAIISDGSGPVAVGETYLDEVPARSVVTARFTWPEALKYQSTESCSVPSDVMIVLDRSGSMREDDKIGGAKTAAVEFARNLTDKDQAGYVSFATQASSPIEEMLTFNKSAIASAIASTTIHTDGLQYTNIADAFAQAQAEITSSRARADSSKAVVFLTDGEPTYPKNPKDAIDKVYPVQKALDAAAALKATGAHVYVIALGKDAIAWSDFMKQIATDPADFFPAVVTADLSGIYKKIGTSICKKGPSVIEIIPRVDISGSTNAPE